MTIAKRTPIFQCLLLAGVISLTACGGSGGGGKKQPPIDTTPNAITLAASTNVEPNTLVTSAPVTISGINTASPVSIVGGEYSVGGGAFTANPGSITNGQTLTVRITASDKTNTPKEAVVTVGGVSAKFAVTTAADVTPDAFAFAPKNDAQLNAEYTSDAITVSGIDVAVAVSVTGGLYSINGGAFTAAAGTVSPGQTITVKTTAAAKTETAQNAVVTIGGVNGTFTVTTIQDSFAPVADFKFPTPYTMSEAMSVKVRGTAMDDNAITNVKVVVRSYKLETPTVTLSTTEINATPKSEANGVKDFSSWTVDVPLTALAENEIKVVATDARNNSIAVDAANKVVIRQANVASAFPDEVNEFSRVFAGLIVDRYDDRNRLLIADPTLNKIVEVNIDTGERKFFSDLESDYAMVLDSSSKRLFIAGSGAINELSLIDGAVLNTFETTPHQVHFDMAVETIAGETNIVFVEHADPLSARVGRLSLGTNKITYLHDQNNLPGLEYSTGITVDESNNRYLITSGFQSDDIEKHAVISVDRTTGVSSIFSSNAVGLGPLFSAGLPSGLTAGLIDAEIDTKRDRVLVSEFPAQLFAIDLITGNRTLFNNVAYEQFPSDYIPYIDVKAMNIDSENDIMFALETNLESVFLIDLVNEERVILSKAKN